MCSLVKSRPVCPLHCVDSLLNPGTDFSAADLHRLTDPSTMERELTCLEMGLTAMLGIFMCNENEDGKITKERFMKIMECELPALLARAQNRDDVFKRWDEDEDGLVTFEEFAKLLAGFAQQNYNDIKEFIKQDEQKAS